MSDDDAPTPPLHEQIRRLYAELPPDPEPPAKPKPSGWIPRAVKSLTNSASMVGCSCLALATTVCLVVVPLCAWALIRAVLHFT